MWNENRTNNHTTNLVVCPNNEYHFLLHKRQQALEACGSADWIKCCYCKQFDDPKNLTVRKLSKAHKSDSGYHRSCAALKTRENRKRRLNKD